MTAATSPSEELTKYELLKKARRDRRVGRYEAVRALYEQGASSMAISRELGLSRTTVRRFMRAEAFPERAVSPRKATILTPYEPYLRERWTAGVHNAYVLWQEIRSRGFTGSAALARRFVSAWRGGPGRVGLQGGYQVSTPALRRQRRNLLRCDPHDRPDGCCFARKTIWMRRSWPTETN
ncbi:MAG: helix-turn-helix domain-containing protein [Actinobacteria bacterium]|nr:helix-turn-helix domain-containing protein [Actinomycetota bacterium]